MLDRLLALSCALVSLSLPALADPGDPPQQTIGERLFLETRFSQYFFAHCNGDMNATLPGGDSVMDTIVTSIDNASHTATILGTPASGPFKGGGMNCRQCHIVDEMQLDEMGNPTGMGNRTYSDYAPRSPIPTREDGLTTTPRNSPALVNSTLARGTGLLFHFDGEYPSISALVSDTFTGRNFGWLPAEVPTALAHIANVIRADNGSDALAQDYDGFSYPVLFKGTDPSIPKDLRLPAGYRLDVSKATDKQIMNAIGRLMTAYVNSLRFSTDATGNYNGTPYDMFLVKNKLPRRPAMNEPAIAYGRRLLGLINKLKTPAFVVDQTDGTFTIHQRPFSFGQSELNGLKTFLRESATAPATVSAGNCIDCHAPPKFTDFKFHNTGASQEEYDAIHGVGAFAQLEVPIYQERGANLEAFLPPTQQHPYGSGRFRAVPDAGHPGYTDLGIWNIFANPDEPGPQAAILRTLFGTTPVTRTQALPLMIGRFKTPGLRDLSDSEPYLHNGTKYSLEEVIAFYQSVSDLARQKLVRNGDPQLAKIRILATGTDAADLVAFLESLTEDYQ